MMAMITLEPLFACTLVIGAVHCISVRRAMIVERITATGSILTLALGIAVAWNVSTSGSIYGYDGYLSIDKLSMLMVLLITSIGAGAILFSLSYIKEEVERGHFTQDRVRWDYGFLNFFVLTMLL